MYIKGTEKLKKRTLNLDSIRQQLKSGHMLPIKDSDFYNPDIQIAYNSGWIEPVGMTPKELIDEEEEQELNNKPVRCRNAHKNSISLEKFKLGIKPGEIFILTESEVHSNDIKAAISRGIIEILGTDEDRDEEFEEGAVSLKDLLKDADGDEEWFDDEPDEPNPSDEAQSQLMEAANKHKEALETNEEITKPAKVVDKKGIVWNKPSEEDEEVKEIKAEDEKRAGITVVDQGGRVQTKNIPSNDEDDIDDILFNKDQNAEIDFVDKQ